MIETTPTLPLASPPLAHPNAVLPSRTLTAFPSHDWIVTQHYYPAAYPRSRVACSTSQRPQKTYSLTPQRKDADTVTKELSDMEQAQRSGSYSTSTDAQNPPLFIAVNRYTPRKPSKGKGLTLLMEHANGLHKEVHHSAIPISFRGAHARADLGADDRPSTWQLTKDFSCSHRGDLGFRCRKPGR